jgi:hypothetical protein
MRPTLLPILSVALLLALAPVPAPARTFEPVEPEAPEAPARDPSLYQAEIELVSQGPAEQRAAAARGLLQVVIKLTGDTAASGNQTVRRALANAESFLLDSRGSESLVDQEGNTAIGGVPVYKTTMNFSFDPGSVDALVAGSGLNYWGPERPRPILWLAIDDGRGARLVNAQQLAVVKPLATRGLERGLRFGLPSGSAVEQAAVETIWALNAAQMQPLTARYGDSAQLLGKVFRSGSGWTSEWVLSQGDTELSRWSASDPSPQLAIAAGADGAADAIARRDAVAIDLGEPGNLTIELAGLRGSNDFTRAMGYLQTLAVVRSVQVLEAQPEALRLQLELAVGPEGFARLVAGGGVLQADSMASQDVPRYLLQP